MWVNYSYIIFLYRREIYDIKKKKKLLCIMYVRFFFFNNGFEIDLL